MLRWLLTLPLLVAVVLFALSNTADVELRLWPFDLAWVAPLSVAVLVFAAFAFLLGALVAWAASLPHRRRARSLEEAGRLLEAQIAELKARAAGPRPVVPGEAVTVQSLPAPAARPARAA